MVMVIVISKTTHLCLALLVLYHRVWISIIGGIIAVVLIGVSLISTHFRITQTLKIQFSDSVVLWEFQDEKDKAERHGKSP